MQTFLRKNCVLKTVCWEYQKLILGRTYFAVRTTPIWR